MTLSSTDYALLAQDAYQDPVLNKPKDLGGVTYEAFDVADNPLTGFQATAYRRMDTGEIVIAYRGTEFDREPVQDGGVDAGMVLTGLNLQTDGSVAFTERVLERAKLEADLHHRPMQVTVTGHSLGGTLAEINAAKFGLKGETFNAYGAAGLREGVPEGGSQVIDHVRAGDLVSAASPHFGEVHIYAAQKDTDTLTKAGYRDDSGILSPRNPIKATDFDAHAIDNFVPDSKLLGRSIINPENESRYRAHEGMIDRYRSDVRDIRMGLSASWEIPKAIGEFKDTVERRLGEVVAEGAVAVERGVGYVAHEVREGFDHLKEDVRRFGHELGNGIQSVEEKASHAWHSLTHPGSWFEHDRPNATLDETGHPDHKLFTQAQSAVHVLDRERQRVPDISSDNLAASLTVAARRDGLDSIDHAILSDDATRTYGIQGSLDSPLKRVTEVPTEVAVRTPVAESTEAWQRLAEQTRQSQTVRTPTPEQTQPSRGL